MPARRPPPPPPPPLLMLLPLMVEVVAEVVAVAVTGQEEKASLAVYDCVSWRCGSLSPTGDGEVEVSDCLGGVRSHSGLVLLGPCLLRRNWLLARMPSSEDSTLGAWRIRWNVRIDQPFLAQGICIYLWTDEGVAAFLSVVCDNQCAGLFCSLVFVFFSRS